MKPFPRSNTSRSACSRPTTEHPVENCGCRTRQKPEGSKVGIPLNSQLFLMWGSQAKNCQQLVALPRPTSAPTSRAFASQQFSLLVCILRSGDATAIE